MNSNSIRKFISRRELDGIWYKYSVESLLKEKILHNLFENSSSIGEHYLLKDNLIDYASILQQINTIIQNNDFAIEFASIFKVESDLLLPQQLRSAFLNNERTCFIVGAGASQSLNYPLWGKLGNDAVKFLYKKNVINSFEKNRLIESELDPKQKLTIFESFFNRQCSEGKEFYHKCFGPRTEEQMPNNIYDLLVQFEGVIKITLNLDSEFQRALENWNNQFTTQSDDETAQPKISKPSCRNFNVETLNDYTIYQIHGNQENLETAVLTTRDYLEAYFSESGYLRSFLAELFKTYTIIFVGCSVSEFPMMEHVLKCGKKHFLLTGAYLNETNLLKIRNAYFSKINVQIIPFYLDFTEYGRLYNVLESWLMEIKAARSASVYDGMKKIDKVLRI
jgi:hypothetical protein